MTSTYVDNIVAVYDRATEFERAEGRGWYADARALVAAIAGNHWSHTDARTIEAAAGVAAALSPVQSTERAFLMTAHVFRVGRCDGGTYAANCDKANRILDGEPPLDVLRGPKVRAFYQCIMAAGRTDQVCVDRHAVAVALGRPADNRERGVLLRVTSGRDRYQEFVDAYTDATARINLRDDCHLWAAQVQAITWVRWRRELEGRAT